MFFTIVDRYFIRKFVMTTFLCFLIMILLLIALDFVMNTDSISELFKEKETNAFKTLGMYYTVWFLNLLQYMDILLVFCGCVFTFYMLEKNSTTTTRGGEIIPMLTSGFPRWRVAIPFLYTGVLMFFLLMAIEEGFFPYCADWPGAKGPASLTAKKEVTLEKKVRDLNTGFIISASKLNLEENKLESPRLGLPRESTHNAPIEQLVFAETATWLPADKAQQRPAGFMMHKVQDYDTVLDFLASSDWSPALMNRTPNAANAPLDGQGETSGNSLELATPADFTQAEPTDENNAGSATQTLPATQSTQAHQEPQNAEMASNVTPSVFFYTSETAPWVRKGDLFVVSNVTLDKLQELDTVIVPESLRRLYHRIVNDPKSVQTSDRIQLHARLLKPVLNSALLFLTIPVILTARLRNKIVITLLLLLLLCAFKGGTVYCYALGEDGTLPPFMVAWTPILFFYGLAAVLFEELYT